ncbi:MAG: LamG domain-containing protein [Myxococcales bacterium]|nr:LamG domain-containing protein [Myxococcales bacterium]
MLALVGLLGSACRGETVIALFASGAVPDAPDAAVMLGAGGPRAAMPARVTLGAPQSPSGVDLGDSWRAPGSDETAVAWGDGGIQAIPGAGGETNQMAAATDDEDAGVDNMGSSLVVRYDFTGTGTTVHDRIGSADALVLGGASLTGAGTLELDGQDDYVNMPNGLVSPLNGLTIMAWVEWSGGICWQRVFDFGSNDGGEDAVGNAHTSLFLTPLTCGGRGTAAVALEVGASSYMIYADTPLASERMMQVTVTVDPAGERTRLYVDGQRVVDAPVLLPIGAIDDVNAWLGRSQWSQDHHFRGRYEEFRIYNRALSARDIREAYERGPDVP